DVPQNRQLAVARHEPLDFERGAPVSAAHVAATPTYERWNAGSAKTSSVEPCASSRPRSSATISSASERTNGRLCSTSRIVQPVPCRRLITFANSVHSASFSPEDGS